MIIRKFLETLYNNVHNCRKELEDARESMKQTYPDNEHGSRIEVKDKTRHEMCITKLHMAESLLDQYWRDHGYQGEPEDEIF